jgi:hypothetical protein
MRGSELKHGAFHSGVTWKRFIEWMKIEESEPFEPFEIMDTEEKSIYV